jgi:hypothetical protein
MLAGCSAGHAVTTWHKIPPPFLSFQGRHGVGEEKFFITIGEANIHGLLLLAERASANSEMAYFR